jgi:WD40-like Beta Propeller Repeat
MRRVAMLLWITTCALLVVSGSAGADVFEPISLVSAITPPAIPADHAEQADYAHDPAISGDGRYVAFDGSFGGVTGVWRRDISNGAVEPVAVGGAGNLEGNAELPSISEGGRYISFTTSAQLVAGDENEGPDVYVRDMDLKESEAGAFTLASAVSGSEESLSYTTSEPTRYGSLAAGRSALSANGQEVAFVTTAISNLAGPETPAMQVAVRDLRTKQTQLVSVVYDPATGTETGEPVPTIGSEGSAAVYPGARLAPRFPVGSPLHTVPVGASLSADGSTVAWLGEDIERQAPVLAHEPHIKPAYTEPLWRRISEGPQALTRRVTGGGDPASPACVANGETAPIEPPTLSDPCQGPFETEPANSNGAGTWSLAPTEDYLPRLSANGMSVAFLSNARYIGGGEEFGTAAESSDDLYVANMENGLTRVQALTRLTEIAGGSSADVDRTAAIADVAISPDGTQLAFSTQRTVFPLGSPAFVSAPAAEPGMLELFDIDLANQTLTRVTQGLDGGPSEQPHTEVSGSQDPYDNEEGAFSPSFSNDGNTLAFASSAANLVYDDGNTPPAVSESLKGERDGSDVFVVRRKTFSSTTPQQYFSPQPPNPTIQPAWLLGVSTHSLADGSVVLYVVAPGPGRLSVSAKSAVRVDSALVHGDGRRARDSVPHGHLGAVATRVVATAAATTRAVVGEVVVSTLTLAPRYRSLAGQHGGLSATVTVLFSAPGHPLLRETIPVTFLRVAHRARGSHASNSRARAKR